MGRFFRSFKNMLMVILLLAIAFGAGYYFGGKNASNNSDKGVVTVSVVETKLFEIGELSTYAGEYTCTLGKEEMRYMFEKLRIPLSTNSIEITCNGVVKVGYNMNDIVVKVDDDKIYVSLPEAQINDNYVIWDTIVCNEVNNLINPIEFSQYHELIDEIEKKGLEDVIANGIYTKAEEHLKVLIEAFLAEFRGYTIVYM